MAKRPALTEDTFLQHLFSPKRNALPTGIRKTALSPGRGRVKGRVAAYNRMTGASQETLRRAGMRDAYLKGEVKLADAKRSLRQVAVSKGYARPTQAKQTPVPYKRTDLDMAVAIHIIKVLRDSDRNPDIEKVHKRVPYMDEVDKMSARHWPIGRVKAYAGDSEKMVIIDGIPTNPLWYH